MIRDMFSVQELLAGRRLHSAGSKQPSTVFRLIQDWRSRVILLSRWQLTSKNLHLSAAVVGVALNRCVSKRPYQKSTQVSAGKLERLALGKIKAPAVECLYQPGSQTRAGLACEVHQCPILTSWSGKVYL